MATILLPAVRRRTVNLFRYGMAGNTETHSGAGSMAAGSSLPTDVRRVVLAEVGVSVGDTLSASAETMNSEGGNRSRMLLRFYDAENSIISQSRGDWADSQEFAAR